MKMSRTFLSITTLLSIITCPIIAMVAYKWFKSRRWNEINEKKRREIQQRKDDQEIKLLDTSIQSVTRAHRSSVDLAETEIINSTASLVNGQPRSPVDVAETEIFNSSVILLNAQPRSSVDIPVVETEIINSTASLINAQPRSSVDIPVVETEIINSTASLINAQPSSSETYEDSSQDSEEWLEETDELETETMATVARKGLDFPFFVHSKTCDYVNNPDTKIMFIMRGLSGSGKSTIVDSIQSTFKQAVICSADHLFYQTDGSYVFDATKLQLAHTKCQENCIVACERGASVVVVDNTNVKRWEMKSYLSTAKSHGYVVVLVEPRTPWKFNAKELSRRNKHGVSKEILETKIRTYADIVPFYYGWFLNEPSSKQLQDLAQRHFKECLKLFPEFKTKLLQHLDATTTYHRSDNETDEEILSRYYNQAGKTTPLLHCTSCFCNGGKIPAAKSYHQRADVQRCYGQVHPLTITGLTLTRSTLGARVTLNAECTALFKRPEEEEWIGLKSEVKTEEFDNRKKKGKKKEKSPKAKSSKHLKSSKAEAKQSSNYAGSVLSGIDDDLTAQMSQLSTRETDGSNKHSMTLNKETDPVTLTESFPRLHNAGKARSCHITLRTADGVASKQTNFDVLNICDIEHKSLYSLPALHRVEMGQALYYGNGICCVYFDQPVMMDALFSGYY